MNEASKDVKVSDVIKELCRKVISALINTLIYSISLRFLFPIVISIIAIQWPEWVVYHSSRISSWFIILLTISIFIDFVMPLFHVKIKNPRGLEL